MDHRIGRGDPHGKRLGSFQVAAMNCDPGRLEPVRPGVGPSEPEDIVAALEQRRDEVGADEAGRAGQKYAHGSLLADEGRIAARSTLLK
ncbi:hypothetical protein FHY05_000547 [Sphingomonas sp. BK580]|nr:hypothetical protein [Sphingomonas sp. BK580]